MKASSLQECSIVAGENAMRYGALGCTILLILLSPSHAQDSAGFMTTAPKSGRFVETNKGWMVPYSRQLPGTNVGFEMVPIPGGMIELETGEPSSKDFRGNSADVGEQV